MMYLRLTFLFISISIFAQESIETSFIKNISIDADTIIGIDNFKTLFYTRNNVFYKKTNNNTSNYSNLQLGNIYSVNTFNSLKTNIFYKDFNTAIILDNRLAEIYKIDFNNLQPYKNVSRITTGPDNTLWVFNQDLQQLELYDYKANITRIKTLPTTSKVLDLKSDYNYCYLLTLNHLYIYNYFGSLISKHKNSGYTALATYNENIILKKENTLYYLKKGNKDVMPISINKNLINQFFVTNETLYIYHNKNLQQFQLKIN
ncbi:hypothetical protein GCM10022291_14340 [Postechiella marina]|uniref:Uncharacterized protein n=1 Tax=Postechiella marina TaxID=943941 RepID=A0ABP8C6K6_9FLAO